MSARHPARVVNATEPQYRAFELIARGKPSGAKPETLRALVAHGLLEVVDNRYQVPLAVHVEWSAWNRHLKSERDSSHGDALRGSGRKG